LFFSFGGCDKILNEGSPTIKDHYLYSTTANFLFTTKCLVLSLFMSVKVAVRKRGNSLAGATIVENGIQ